MAPRLVKLADNFSCYTSGEHEAQFIYQEIFEHHGYDGPVLPDAPFIVDAGANIGLFSLYMKEKHPLARILAFEPAPESFETLKKNLALHNVSDVVAYPYALGTQACTAAFTYFPNVPGNSTLNMEEKRHQIQLFQENCSDILSDDVFEGAAEITVPVNRLSYFLNRDHSDVAAIDLLKIDVEGTELEVLGGLDDADWKKVRNIVMEVSDLEGSLEAARQLLESKGFTVTYVASREMPEVFKMYILTACQ
ncbi:S-adenosyl-L-methionine-dependent methyltransferase [Aspergillus alliaceus]|uniref:S-adenosyl-L-methionine-dependent methyltransferase n=1 Tax=Petromyces alliaceus TaxID=209559 RepID=UPI0012A3F754|nr:S-adenosyl-L-methionine-dependent methyltransferase [Aspergillus alliaceus]KAB8228165.1 S-adenosyl-L-methionine-dependent methyltransferase [Aspergillus alliaceus]